MPHAKFHLAWLLSTNSLLALFSIYLIWIKGKAIAGLIGIIVMGGFWIAAFTRNFYGGLFVDPKKSQKLWDFILCICFYFVSLFLIVGTYLQFKLSKNEKGLDSLC